jgi:hypothetical protein
MIADDFLSCRINGAQPIPEPFLHVVLSVCHMPCGAFYVTSIIVRLSSACGRF